MNNGWGRMIRRDDGLKRMISSLVNNGLGRMIERLVNNGLGRKIR
jgi:hypothetical protein